MIEWKKPTFKGIEECEIKSFGAFLWKELSTEAEVLFPPDTIFGCLVQQNPLQITPIFMESFCGRLKTWLRLDFVSTDEFPLLRCYMKKTLKKARIYPGGKAKEEIYQKQDRETCSDDMNFVIILWLPNIIMLMSCDHHSNKKRGGLWYEALNSLF